MKCRKNIESKNLKGLETKSERVMLLLKCAVCDGRTLKLIKEQEARWLLSSLGIRTSSSQIPLLDPLLF